MGAAFSIGTPLVAREHPHELELVAVGVGAVDALGRAVTRLAGVGVSVEERSAGVGELVDGVELPGEVVEADRAASPGFVGGADAEQAEVVVVLGAGQSQERCVGAWFAGDDIHAEDVGVEAHRAVEVGDEQDGVIEANRRN